MMFTGQAGLSRDDSFHGISQVAYFFKLGTFGMRIATLRTFYIYTST
jgi:hypothetical protein